MKTIHGHSRDLGSSCRNMHVDQAWFLKRHRSLNLYQAIDSQQQDGHIDVEIAYFSEDEALLLVILSQAVRHLTSRVLASSRLSSDLPWFRRTSRRPFSYAIVSSARRHLSHPRCRRPTEAYTSVITFRCLRPSSRRDACPWRVAFDDVLQSFTLTVSWMETRGSSA